MDRAVAWFHEKWGVPEESYRESMQACLRKDTAVPQWYLVLEGKKIIAGVGVIENDFHQRKDLTPNLCALYVEETHRNQGIAGELLQFVCSDFAKKGIDTLYLITEHTAFYERYGWDFLCMVEEMETSALIRMYVHKNI